MGEEVETPCVRRSAAGVQAVVELAKESVEQVPVGLVVPVSGGAAGIVVFAVRPGSGPTPARAQVGPTATKHQFLMCRGSTMVFLPPVRVIVMPGRFPDMIDPDRTFGNACRSPTSSAGEPEASALVNIRARHWWGRIYWVRALAPSR